MKPTAPPSPPPRAPGGGVCFVYKEDYPWDVRVEKILLTLAAAGRDVALVCRNTKRLPRRQQAEGFRIFRLPALPAWTGRLNDLLTIPFYFNPYWLFWMWRYARASRARVMIVRDLPLMPLGILAGRMAGLKVIFDMAECYPEMYRSTLQFSDRKIGKYLLKNPVFAGWMERFSFRGADHVFVMVQESRDRLLRLGADPAKVTIVSNTPSAAGRITPRRHAAGGVLRLLYVGFVTRIRGLDNVLRGLRAYLDRKDPPVRIEFDVVGIGAGLADYRRLCGELGLDDHVRFQGWCPQETVDALYRRSDVGILTYHVCSHWNHTIPNKLFDYMLAGIPVLATDVVPIRRIIESTGCGLVFPDFDAEACAERLAELADPAVRDRMAEQGHRAVLDRYNWEQDTARMMAALSGLGK